MNLQGIAAEVAEVLAGLPDVRTAFPYPPKKIGGFPAAIVSYPESLEYGVFADNSHRLTWPVAIVVGGAVERETAALLSGYVSDVGAASVLAALNDKADWLTVDSVTVESAEASVISIAGIEYMAVVFTLNIAVTTDER